MNEYLQKLLNFLAVNDFPTLAERIRQLNWLEVIKNPVFWVTVVPITVALLWKKKYKFLTAIASLGAFVVLLQFTLPPMGDKIPLHDLVIFCGGAFGLIVLNLYLLFIRE